MICNLYNLYIPKYSKNTQEIIFFKSINFVITHRIFNIEFDSGPLKQEKSQRNIYLSAIDKVYINIIFTVKYHF